ncbi:esterase-like activity of phytase family protein [Bradyrhizobium sp. STM 3557]|uniref:esterase-like activity of phytase family protein n=1 Tax=Bradyrhizobium sp. STM 3557 TaxID=578920 RepID=UPI00389050BA
MSQYPNLARRRFLTLATAGFATLAGHGAAHAQLSQQATAKRRTRNAFSAGAPVPIDVNARPLPSFDLRDRSRIRFGKLEYRSGLVLTSSFPGFGGLSAFRFLEPNGERFISVSDQGAWFTGRIVYSGRAMAGLAEVEAAPLLFMDGKPITEHGWYDSESLAIDGDIAYVGLERVNQVMRFDFSKGFIRARGEVVPLPAVAEQLPDNQGLEALVMVPKGLPLAGTLIALSERGLNADGNLIAFLVGGPSPGQFSVRRTDNFDISDAVILPPGDLLVLERKSSLFSGVGIRIRRIALASITPGALVDGAAIFNAGLGQEIDNMEGIDAHVTPEGDTVLSMLSDDNFSMIQRTLLLQFTLVE